jgi:hypothetical protein
VTPLRSPRAAWQAGDGGPVVELLRQDACAVLHGRDGLLSRVARARAVTVLASPQLDSAALCYHLVCDLALRPVADTAAVAAAHSAMLERMWTDVALFARLTASIQRCLDEPPSSPARSERAAAAVAAVAAMWQRIARTRGGAWLHALQTHGAGS